MEGIVVLVLESPHIDEFFPNGLDSYNKNNKVYSRPANGVTGKNIEKFFISIFKENLIRNLKKDGKYAVALVNSVQQQCSLGVKPLYYRDRVWVPYWAKYKKDFLERIKILSLTMIINCATLGEHYQMNKEGDGYDKNKLKFTQTFIVEEFPELNKKFIIDSNSNFSIRSLITHELKSKFNSEIIYLSNHPSSWNYEKNRKIVKE